MTRTGVFRQRPGASLIQIKAKVRPPPHDISMNDATGSGSESQRSTRQVAERARSLRMQADRCVDMAAKVGDPQLFRA
ncbi:MAG: hypothetical protein JO128_21225 [Alphaproteobacteria bacterium]|nr:hypothetical protein [Alphaproteobacteria bacterium]